jgi:hypothetical protein
MDPVQPVLGGHEVHRITGDHMTRHRLDRNPPDMRLAEVDPRIHLYSGTVRHPDPPR